MYLKLISWLLFKILDNRLSTAGIWQFSYKVHNEGIHQTNKFDENAAVNSWPVLDVRDLYDDSSNSLENYEEKMI